MKRKISVLTILMILLISIKTGATNELVPLDASIYMNGEPVSFSVPLITYNGRTLVPMRELFEKLGATVEWVGNEQKIISTTKTKTIEMWINNNTVICNDIKLLIDAPPILYNDKTLVPLRFIGEQLNLDVIWNDKTKIITMNSKGTVSTGNVSHTFWDDINKCEIRKEYSGEIVDGIPSGIGTMHHYIIENGKTTHSLREGCFSNWKENGWVYTTTSAGDIIVGNYKNGVPEGIFAILFSSGNCWEGEVINFGEAVCIPHGNGVFTYSDGAKYYCNMDHFSMEGYAELYNPQGILIFAGEHSKNAANGYGKLYNDYGSLVYEGNFANGYYHGYGKQYSNGSLIYEGEYAEGDYCGMGRLYDEIGNLIYSGIFPIQNNIYNYNEIEPHSFITNQNQFDYDTTNNTSNNKTSFDVSLYNSNEAIKIYKKYNLDTSWIIDGVLVGFDSYKGITARTEYEKQQYEEYKRKYEYHQAYLPIANAEIKAMFGY